MSDKFLTEEDPIINNLINLLKVPKGSLTVKTNDTPAFSLEFRGDKVLLDITDASFFLSKDFTSRSELSCITLRTCF